MKATLFHKHGGPEVLEYTEIEEPKVQPNSVIIDVKAVALNHLDLFVRNGIPGIELEMPHILGSDISGVVKETGEQVPSSIKEGQRVIVDPALSCGSCHACIRGEESLCPDFQIIGEHVRGGYAELFGIHHENIIPIPDSVDLTFSEAAAVPLTFMTAWRLMITKARVKPGQKVLIIGIGGGVALAALQISKVTGATVFVTSSSDAKLKKAERMGADYGINYIDKPDFHKEIWSKTNSRGVDVVFDSVGEATWQKSLRSLKKGGRLVTCGATSGQKAVTNVNLVFWNQLEILGSTMASRSELRDVLDLIWAGKLKPVIDRTLPLSKASEAHKILENGEQFGKIVLETP
ncbi:alcohol dehydrogenase [Candidatus Thorarchaeota archaeon]|nr:MAG: alcohol dehydrogenase [Candidatus Thorarchaeota archaeon]